MFLFVAIFLTAMLAALLLTPVAARLARKLRVVDEPGVRKIHLAAVPYFGGLAIYAALTVGAIVLVLLARDPSRSFARLDGRMLWVIAGATVMFVLGLIDDIRYVRARYKLLVQVGAAAAVWLAGVRIEQIQLFDGFAIEFGAFSILVTVLWIVGITNAINLIDGIDGLAAGIASIGCAAIAFVAFQTGNLPMAALLCGVLGAIVGFLPHNLNPARVFLGDSGTLLLGFVLSSCAILTAAKSATFVGLAVPAVALGVPIFDTAFSMTRRLIERRSIMAPDRRHIHHRLLALGYGQARIVQLLCLETLIATGLGLLMIEASGVARLATFAGVIAIHLFLFRVTGAIRIKESIHAFRRSAAITREASEQRKEYDDLVLHFRESRTFTDWWTAVCLAGERMGFASIDLDLENRDGSRRELCWTREPGIERIVEVQVPIRDRRSAQEPTASVRIPVDGSIESAGHRMRLFGRLLDEYSLAELPASSTPRRHYENPRVAEARPDIAG